MNPKEIAKKVYTVSNNEYMDPGLYVFSESNENLAELFKKYNVGNKVVLSVLSSSDQLFSCYVEHAKEVDTFDKVYITLYYYYLRKWIIENKNMLYLPSQLFCSGDFEIYKLICNLKPKSKKEEEAKIFWKTYLKYKNYKLGNIIFSETTKREAKPFDEHIDCLKSKLKDDISFKNFNLEDNIKLNKKYDVIILSNILEYINTSPTKLVTVRDNLENLLNDDGIVICSYLMKNSYLHNREIEILTRNKLQFENKTTYYDNISKTNKDLAYTYRKTR